MALISVTEAFQRIHSGLSRLGVERVPISEAHGRVLAADLGAKQTQPPFDASAMDGYAVRAADVAALPATLALVGESAAGARFDGTVGPGQAVRIFTGAPVPEGADTIVIQEDTEEDDGRVVVKEATPGRHIRPRGQDFKEGDVLLKDGTRLGARGLILAAAMNYADLLVYRRPKVAILSTGDEIVPPGGANGPDQIVASVSYGLAALVETYGGIAIDLGIAPDDEDALVDAISRGADADILVTIGGASVGERDLMKTALARAGMQLDFAGVAMRPGKPVFHGRLGDQRVLGLPGNPVSAFICCVIFLRAMLGSLLGEDRAVVPHQAILDTALLANGPRQHYQRATSTYSDDGTRHVALLSSQDSSLMASLAKADCLIVQPPRHPGLAEGTKVLVTPLPD
jgi:molybdopterin molybdotransferase